MLHNILNPTVKDITELVKSKYLNILVMLKPFHQRPSHIMFCI